MKNLTDDDLRPVQGGLLAPPEPLETPPDVGTGPQPKFPRDAGTQHGPPHPTMPPLPRLRPSTPPLPRPRPKYHGY